MTDEELVKEIREGRAQPVELWLQLRPFIQTIAKRYKDVAELEDLMQESYFGLLSAIQLYDPGKESSFSNYAHYWIKQAMLRSIDNFGSVVRVPVNAAGRARRYRRICAEFRRDLNREPTDRELCASLGVSADQLRQIRIADTMLRIGTLDTPLAEDQETTVGDMVPDRSVDVEAEVLNSVQQEQLSAALWGAVNTLSEQQAECIRKRYRDGMTMKETGEAMGVSASRIHTIEETALRKMRAGKIRRSLSPFLDDIRYSAAMRGSMNAFQSTRESPTERAAFKVIEVEDRLKRSGLL